MNCKKCGTEIPEGSHQCPNCGLELSPVSNSQKQDQIPALPKPDKMEAASADNSQEADVKPDADKELESASKVEDSNSPQISAKEETQETESSSSSPSKEDTAKTADLETPSENKKAGSAASFNIGVWNIMAIISTVLGCLTLFQGFDKMYSYHNNPYSSYNNINAYVQGDAYNFIINGTYATAFFVLTAMFFLLAVGFKVLHYLSRNKARPS